jgi:hypothetical protein
MAFDRPILPARRHSGRLTRGSAPRGSTLVYLTMAMVALIGFSSLAVDLGRVQVAKSELQRAADAAARYGATALDQGPDVVERFAVDAADDNLADGTPVVLNAAVGDVQVGTWDEVNHTFEALYGADRSRANSVQVIACRTVARGNGVPLLWAQLIGRSYCDVTARAVAIYYPPMGGYGVVGLNSVSMNGSSRVDGYHSDRGAYGGGNVDSGQSVASNGVISTQGSAEIIGAAESTLGPSGTNNAKATRTGTPKTPLRYPVPSTGGKDGTDGDFTGVTLSAGTYYFRDFKPGNPLNLTGPVTVFVSGDVGTVRSVSTFQSLPKNFKLVVTSASNFDIDIAVGSNRDVFADVYAPNSDLSLTGSADLYGRVIARSISMGGTSGIHIDESLAPPQTSSGVALVK